MTGKNRKKKGFVGTLVAQNRKARHDYLIEEKFEAGIMLMGSEVKSLRAGKASINEAYAHEKDGEVWLVNAHIAEYDPAKTLGHESRRPRKLLLRHREIARLTGAVRRQGMTLIPLAIYFNERGLAKVELALARGKHTIDKRQTLKDRDWARQKARLMRLKG